MNGEKNVHKPERLKIDIDNKRCSQKKNFHLKRFSRLSIFFRSYESTPNFSYYILTFPDQHNYCYCIGITV